VLTQPEEYDLDQHPKNATSITSTYVKFIESAGGRVVPIHFTHTFERLDDIMSNINGILFTGGDLDLIDPQTGEYSQYTKLASHIYQKAKEINDNGVVFPLWGTCQGHQLMMLLESQNNQIIQPTERYYEADTLVLHNPRDSRIFEDFSDSLLNKLQTEATTYNIHHFGVHLDDFENSERYLIFLICIDYQAFIKCWQPTMMKVE